MVEIRGWGIRLIEFKVKHEGCESSTAWVTLAKWLPFKGRHRGLYFEFCIPLWNMTREDWVFDGEIYGWYGLSIRLGYFVTNSGGVRLLGWAHLRVLKIFTKKTREYIEAERLNES